MPVKVRISDEQLAQPGVGKALGWCSTSSTGWGPPWWGFRFKVPGTRSSLAGSATAGSPPRVATSASTATRHRLSCSGGSPSASTQ